MCVNGENNLAEHCTRELNIFIGDLDNYSLYSVKQPVVKDHFQTMTLER